MPSVGSWKEVMKTSNTERPAIDRCKGDMISGIVAIRTVYILTADTGDPIYTYSHGPPSIPTHLEQVSDPQVSVPFYKLVWSISSHELKMHSLQDSYEGR